MNSQSLRTSVFNDHLLLTNKYPNPHLTAVTLAFWSTSIPVLLKLSKPEYWFIGGMILGYGLAIWVVITTRLKDRTIDFQFDWKLYIGRSFFGSWAAGALVCLDVWTFSDDWEKAIYTGFATMVVATGLYHIYLKSMWYIFRHLERLGQLEQAGFISPAQKMCMAEEIIRAYFTN